MHKINNSLYQVSDYSKTFLLSSFKYSLSFIKRRISSYLIQTIFVTNYHFKNLTPFRFLLKCCVVHIWKMLKNPKNLNSNYLPLFNKSGLYFYIHQKVTLKYSLTLCYWNFVSSTVYGGGTVLHSIGTQCDVALYSFGRAAERLPTVIHYKRLNRNVASPRHM